MKIITALAENGNRYYFEVDDAVADAIDWSAASIKFDNVNGATIGLSLEKLIYLAVGDDRHMGFQVGEEEA